jgi:hypothetical protein
MVVDEKLRSELLKEALGRANKLEKQEYEKITARQKEIGENDVALVIKWKELCEQDERNKCSNETESKNRKPVAEMSMDEFDLYMAANSKYFSESISFCTETSKITRELFESVIELWNLTEQEKWLLLSITLRSQPNLSKYMH